MKGITINKISQKPFKITQMEKKIKKLQILEYLLMVVLLIMVLLPLIVFTQ